MAFHKPDRVFVDKIEIVAIFWGGQQIGPQRLISVEIGFKSFPQGRQRRFFLLEYHLLDCRERIGHSGDPHTADPMDGGVEGAAVVDIQAAANAVPAEAG